MSTSRTTIDHEEIRRWVEERQGRPARVKGTAKGEDAGARKSRAGQSGGMLRIDFAEPDERLEPISWDEFFATFDSNGLALLFQEQTADGKPSRFNKLVSR